MIKRIIPDVAATLLILLFAYAAVSKLIVYSKFVVQIAQSPVLAGMSPYIAWMIPAVELIICLLLVLPQWRVWGLYAASGLMAIFTVYVGAVLFFSSTLPCSCGGILNQMGWKSHLVFNTLFTGVALTGLIFEKWSMKNIDPPEPLNNNLHSLNEPA